MQKPPRSHTTSQGDRALPIEVEHVLKAPPSRWDKQVAADLIAEMETHLGKIDTVPEMRQALALSGYRGLQQRIEKAIEGQSGVDALRAMAFAMRSFALGSPGLAAASFRNPYADSPECREAGENLAKLVSGVFGAMGYENQSAKHAIRILKSLVRGFVLNEMASSNARPLEYQKSYVLAIEQFILGLPALKNLESAEKE